MAEAREAAGEEEDVPATHRAPPCAEIATVEVESGGEAEGLDADDAGEVGCFWGVCSWVVDSRLGGHGSVSTHRGRTGANLQATGLKRVAGRSPARVDESPRSALVFPSGSGGGPRGSGTVPRLAPERRFGPISTGIGRAWADCSPYFETLDQTRSFFNQIVTMLANREKLTNYDQCWSKFVNKWSTSANIKPTIRSISAQIGQ